MTMMKRIAIAAVEPRDRPDLAARDLRKRSTAVPGRGPQDDRIVDGASETHAGDEPDESRGVSELRGQHRPNQGSRAGNRGKVMAEEDPAEVG